MERKSKTFVPSKEQTDKGKTKNSGKFYPISITFPHPPVKDSTNSEKYQE